MPSAADREPVMIYKKPLLLCLLVFLSACSTMPRPPLDYRSGAQVETLSSAVSMSIHSSERSMSGHGFLVYRRPDQVHLIMLSPFGPTLFEAFALGEKVVLVYPSQSVAYSGRLDELPDKGGLQSWRLIRWVMDVDASTGTRSNETISRQSKLGFEEQVTFADGLVTTKAAPNGDQVFYSDYRVINGVAVAEKIEMRNVNGDRLRLKMDEPEINVPLDETAFKPRLDGMSILPLNALQGIR